MRLAERPEDEWGGQEKERKIIRRLHATKEDIPENAIIIDATVSLDHIVDTILEKT